MAKIKLKCKDSFSARLIVGSIFILMLCAGMIFTASFPARAEGDRQVPLTSQNKNVPTEAEQSAPILDEEKIVPFKSDLPLLALSRGKPTTPLQIASIFHKMAGTEPDFRLWAESTAQYQEALDIDKQEIFTRSYNRIVKSFRELDETQIVVVQTKIHFGDYSEIQAIQVVDVFHDKTYFRYNANGEYFAVIPHKLEQFKYLHLTPERRREMMGKNGDSNTFQAEFFLKINKIDSEAPQELEPERKFWLMLGDIVEMRIWTNHNAPRLVWRYQADWYDGYRDPELMNLYQGQNVVIP